MSDDARRAAIGAMAALALGSVAVGLLGIAAVLWGWLGFWIALVVVGAVFGHSINKLDE